MPSNLLTELPNVPNKSPKDAEMSDAVYTQPDAVYAKSIIEEIWPPRLYSRKSIITFAFEGVKRVERSLSDAVKANRKRQWTERRVRSIVDDEQPCLERYEVADLERMAVREGRDAYRKSVERAARLASFLAVADEAFHGPEIAAYEAAVRLMAGAGVGAAGQGTSRLGAGDDRAGELAGGLAGTRDSGAGR